MSEPEVALDQDNRCVSPRKNQFDCLGVQLVAIQVWGFGGFGHGFTRENFVRCVKTKARCVPVSPLLPRHATHCVAAIWRMRSRKNAREFIVKSSAGAKRSGEARSSAKQDRNGMACRPKSSRQPGGWGGRRAKSHCSVKETHERWEVGGGDIFIIKADVLDRCRRKEARCPAWYLAFGRRLPLNEIERIERALSWIGPEIRGAYGLRTRKGKYRAAGTGPLFAQIRKKAVEHPEAVAVDLIITMDGKLDEWIAREMRPHSRSRITFGEEMRTLPSTIALEERKVCP